MLFENMNFEAWQEVLQPKVRGTTNLYDQLSSADLDFFVILSSSAGVMGNTSQSNYAASSTFQDSMARHLSSRGLPVVALDLGMILSVGFVAENEGALANLKKWNFRGIRNEEFLAMLKYSIVEARRSPTDSQMITGLAPPRNLSADEEIPLHLQEPRFSHVLQLGKTSEVGPSQEGRVRLQDVLKSVHSMSDAQRAVCDALVSKMSTLLKIPLEDISPSSPMAAYGVDSLVAVELRNWTFHEAKADVPVLELLAAKSLMSLSGEIAKKSQLLTGLEGETTADAEQ